MDDMKLLHGDCLELMKDIPDESVDMILTDPPYGTTCCEWDKPVDLSAMWEQILRVAKPDAAMVFFSQQPFAAELIRSNKKLFRYEWIWEKSNATGFLNAKKMPMKAHENILVFYRRLPRYNPQFTQGKPYVRNRNSVGKCYDYERCYSTATISDGKRYPRDVIKFKSVSKTIHETQKPTELLEYLINTYTSTGDTVLDPFMGSGSTGIACMNTGRKFIGMEIDEKYFTAAQEHIQQERAQVSIFE